MASYWKTKVLPRIKKVFDKNGKKAAAAEACKSFDGSKEEINKEFEEKKTELHTKVVEIYEASSAEIKTLVKERKSSGVKKHSAAVHKFIEDLEKIDFPGSKPVCEASKTYGPAYVSGPILFIFEKVSTFVVTVEEKEAVVEPTATTEATTTTEEGPAATETKEKEIVEEGSSEKVEEKKEKEEIISTPAGPAPVPVPEPEVVVEAEKAEPAAVCEPAPVPACEPAKTEEAEPAKK